MLLRGEQTVLIRAPSGGCKAYVEGTQIVPQTPEEPKKTFRIKKFHTIILSSQR